MSHAQRWKRDCKAKGKGTPDEEQRSAAMRRRVRRGETKADGKEKETGRHRCDWKKREKDCNIKVRVKLVPLGHSGSFFFSPFLQFTAPTASGGAAASWDRHHQGCWHTALSISLTELFKVSLLMVTEHVEKTASLHSLSLVVLPPLP